MTTSGWGLLAFLVLALGSGEDPYPAPLLEGSGLRASRFGKCAFAARTGRRLDAETYRATGFDPGEGPIWFVLHGVGRTARSYLEAAAPVAERHGALAIALRFSEIDYPGSESYTLGVKRRGPVDGGRYDPSEWREPSDYVYSELEHVFETVRGELGGRQAGYYVFGHSAGAQFAHRLLTFLPGARVLGAVAANAGWYTMPSADRDFPYGLRGTPLAESDLRDLVTAPLTVLLGERDVTTPDEDRLVRGTAEAMAQGPNRLARGRAYWAAGEARARALAEPFAWRLAVVPGAGHDKDEMMPSAGFFLFDPGAPCGASAAAGARIVITEIHADPAKGPAGDANGDGVRDPAQDEFVELVNTGPEPLCLAGWTLGDARDPERHRFPLGRTLAPGAALVVFGGGEPTGAFGGAMVQWAAFGGRLDLTNRGDVVTLRDASGVPVASVSWGDRDGAHRARDHYDAGLDIGGSIVRWPEPGGTWRPHREAAGTAWSPGTRADGTPWTSD